MKYEAWEMTRKAKTVKDLDRLETRWKEESKLSGADKTVHELEGLFRKGKVRGLSPEERLKEARECLSFAVEHHMERESAIGEGEMMRTALQAGRGKITKEDLDKVWKEEIDKKEIIRQEGDGLEGWSLFRKSFAFPSDHRCLSQCYGHPSIFLRLRFLLTNIQRLRSNPVS